MPAPITPSVASTVIPPITWSQIVNSAGFLTPAGLNLFQQIWAGIYGGGGIADKLPKPGDMKPVGGATAQEGWLLCDGAAYPDGTHPDLFTAIGTTWGTAGPGTFRVPNLKGNFIIGSDGTHALGAMGGALSRTIAQANLPAYDLTVTDPGHDHGVTDPGHHHTALVAASTNTAGAAAGSSTAGNTGNSVTGISINSAVTGIVVALGGGGVDLDTTPTFAAVNWLIKT